MKADSTFLKIRGQRTIQSYNFLVHKLTKKDRNSTFYLKYDFNVQKGTSIPATNNITETHRYDCHNHAARGKVISTEITDSITTRFNSIFR